MKKYSVLLFAFLITASVISAQAFQKGTNVISAGVGLGSSLGSFTYGSQTPAFSLQYEKGIWEVGGPGVISLGGYAGKKTYKYGSTYGSYSYDEKWSYTVIGLRSAYHYNGINNEKLDVYAGVMLSYNIVSYKYTDTDPYDTYQYRGSYGSAAGFTAYVGGRYFFAKTLGVFAEAGYGVSYLNLGAALRF